MNESLARTPLYDWHAAAGAKLVEFGGWLMPVQYTSIVAEHHATRQAVGLFDISHMGRIRFDGADAAAFLDSLVTRRVTDLAPGQIRYGLMTNEAGGILDDVLVYRLHDAVGGNYYLLVVNASNRSKILSWIAKHRATSGLKQVEYTDLTTTWAMIAVQGPNALALLQPFIETSLADLSYYTGMETRICGHGGIVSRTGYTGEDGCELIVGSAIACSVWQRLIDAGRSMGTLPAGLGCRDTLRLEAAMPLYGHELGEQINPYQAGLSFAVNLEGRDFVGREALVKFKADKSQTRRIGLMLTGKRIAREHATILSGSTSIGMTTSGTFSPTLERPIAMGYVAPTHATIGTELAIEIRGTSEPARVVKLPFYQRAKV